MKSTIFEWMNDGRVSKEINFKHGFRAGISMINDARFLFSMKNHTRFYLVGFRFFFFFIQKRIIGNFFLFSCAAKIDISLTLVSSWNSRTKKKKSISANKPNNLLRSKTIRSRSNCTPTETIKSFDLCACFGGDLLLVFLTLPLSVYVCVFIMVFVTNWITAKGMRSRAAACCSSKWCTGHNEDTDVTDLI